MDAAREDILVLLSAYRDGELSGAEKERVEEALRSDPVLAARLADHETFSQVFHDSFESIADDVDFSGFADRVVAQVTPARPPLWERIRVTVSELFEFRRMELISGAVAAAVLLVAGPVLISQAVVEQQAVPGELFADAGAYSNVISVTPEENTDTMLFKTASGTTVIYLQATP